MDEKNQTKIVLALTVFFLTVSCATFHPQPISPAQTALTFENRRLDNVKLKEFLEKNLHHEITPWPRGSFDFTVLTLVAFYYHPDLDLARAKWGLSQAGVITAGQRPNPDISFTPQYNVNAASGVSPWILTFSFDIPIETAGKRGYRIAQAKHLSESARLSIATVAWQIRSRLRTSLLNFYAADQSEVLLRNQLAIQEDLVELMERQLAVGELSRPVVTQAHLSVDQIRLSLTEAKKQRVEARVRIADALGLSVEALKEIEISFAFLEKLPEELPSPGTRRQALLNRADILSALADYAASQSALQLQIAKQYPDIHLGPGYEFDQGENKWAIGVSVTLPVFNQNQGPIAEAEARRKQAEARFAALQARIIGEIDATQAGYRAVLEELEAADSLVSHKESELQSMQAMFKVGQVDRLALLNTQLELASNKLSRLDALVKTQQSLGLLEDALQYPINPSEPFPVVPEKNLREKEGTNGR
jgi:cobalt-zinc-cadmium efflux system outer membrane protein